MIAKAAADNAMLAAGKQEATEAQTQQRVTAGGGGVKLKRLAKAGKRASMVAAQPAAYAR
jgi:hypothetical protein